MISPHHKSFDSKFCGEETENGDEGRWVDMPNTPVTCNPHKTTKTTRVWNNAIRRPACGYARQSMSLYPNPRIPVFKFLRATRLSSKCFI